MTRETTAKMKKTPQRPVRGKPGWQAEKSEMMRRSILSAAVECFIDLGYANTTTALIAEYAGVSRGAMMHHFPSRQSVLTAVVEHLQELRLNEYQTFMANIDVPDRQLNKKSIRDSVEAAWQYVNTPSFIAYEELLAASRTDPELRSVMQPVELYFEEKFLERVRSVFPHWKGLEILEQAHDVVQFLMRGMATSHMTTNKDARAERMIDYLTDALYQMYQVTSKNYGLDEK